MLNVFKTYLLSTIISLGIFCVFFIFNGFKSSYAFFESMMFLVLLVSIKEILNKHHQFRGIYLYRKDWDKIMVVFHFLNLFVLGLFFVPKWMRGEGLIEEVFFGFKFAYLLPVLFMLYVLKTSKLRETIRFRKNKIKFNWGKYTYLIGYHEIQNFNLKNDSLSFQVGDKNFEFELVHHQTELIDQLKELAKNKGVS